MNLLLPKAQRDGLVQWISRVAAHMPHGEVASVLQSMMALPEAPAERPAAETPAHPPFPPVVPDHVDARR